MQNIIIVCADKGLRKDLSKALASELGFLYVDVDEVVDFDILNMSDTALSTAKQELDELEKKSIKRVLDFNNCIITISRDLFIANNNFTLFEQCKKIFVVLPKAYFVAKYSNCDMGKLEQELLMCDKINKLTKTYSDMTIDKSVKTTDDMMKEILDKLKKT